MALQWFVTAILVALCLTYVVKGLLPKAGAATCGGGCKGCSSADAADSNPHSQGKNCTAFTAGNAAKPLVFYPPQKPKI
jgi:hypothetical protein